MNKDAFSGFHPAVNLAFSIYRFDKRDAAVLGILMLLCIGASVPHLAGQMGWTYYPDEDRHAAVSAADPADHLGRTEIRRRSEVYADLLCGHI